MFLLISKYVKSLDEVDKVLEAHRAFLKKYYDNGTFLCSGRMNPRTGGVIICRGDNPDTVRNILKEDPFFTEKVSEYEIIEFVPTMFTEGFDKFI